jgi:hypothetical protein
MTHVGIREMKGILPPLVDLAGGCCPHDIFEQNIAGSRLRKGETEVVVDTAHVVLLKAGASTGGLMNAWGNSDVLVRSLKFSKASGKFESEEPTSSKAW